MAVNRHFDAVIFDLDGTLVDSLSLWHDIDIRFFGERGIVIPDTIQKEIGGFSMHEIAVYFQKTYGVKDSIEEMIDIWNNMAYDAYRNDIGLKKGADRLLNQIRSLGMKTGLATSNSRELVEACFEKNDLFGRIDIIVSSNEVKNGKPAPDVYLKCAELLETPPEKCFVFEDLPDGIAAAKAAGMTVCAVDDSFTANETAEKKRLSDLYIEDFDAFDRTLL